MEVRIRLLIETDSGVIEDIREDYDLVDFGGVMPAVGDLIVNPGAVGDRREPKNREIMEVNKRYIQPSTSSDDDHLYWHLIVRIRQATEGERIIACRA